MHLRPGLMRVPLPLQNSPSAEDLKLSSGERWIAIASWGDLVHAVGIATVYAGYQPRVFYSENGWYAVVLGPSTATDIRGFRASHRGPSLPADAYLTNGSGYVATV